MPRRLTSSTTSGRSRNDCPCHAARYRLAGPATAVQLPAARSAFRVARDEVAASNRIVGPWPGVTFDERSTLNAWKCDRRPARGQGLCHHRCGWLNNHPSAGSIINTASFLAVMGAATSRMAYSAARAGVIQLSRDLGTNLARRGVRVNALCLVQSIPPNCRRPSMIDRMRSRCDARTGRWAVMGQSRR